jgi:hypothetical protein
MEKKTGKIERVDGMPLKTILKLISSKKTPKAIKEAWQKKLSLIDLEKMGKVL